MRWELAPAVKVQQPHKENDHRNVKETVAETVWFPLFRQSTILLIPIKNMIWKNIACLLLLLSFVSGCGQNVPDGFPEVVPLTVWVTDGEKPLNEVFVVLEMVPPASGVSVAAKTDATGKAVMQTSIGNFSKAGVPIGKAVMTLLKTPVAEDWKTPEEQSKMPMEELMAYSNEKAARSAKLPLIVPKSLTNAKTSPLTKEISAGQPSEWKIDIAEFRK
ncbi:MAG: hypothetical protein LBQ54_04075 [Planctomycetaceae bacterium]|nr:hypothetical protein [Planctomycetaceae bacterium]